MRTYTDLMVQEEFDNGMSVLPQELMPPPIRYVVVGSPRTGTNLLCDLLYQTGMGVPMEYLTGPTARQLADRWSVMPTEYLHQVMHRRTNPDNGVFGLKITQPHEWEAAQGIWPTHVIQVVREDRQAQILSLARALKTQYWADVGDPDDRPLAVEPTDQELTQAESTVVGLSQVWQQLPSDLQVSYEFLVKDRETAIRTIVEQLLGLELPEGWECPTPRVKKLHYGGPVDLAELA
jgi:LPS sulfotransferase NodH